jgi:chromosome segregation ATPase
LPTPVGGYGSFMKRVSVIVLCVLLSACFSESGLTDEFRDATNAIDDLVEAIRDEGPVREAVAQVRDTVDEANAALEAYRENPNDETRQALEDAERRMSDARAELEGLVDSAPEPVRDAIRSVIDRLANLRDDIARELED